MKICKKQLKFAPMKNIYKISDTSFSPIISIGTPYEGGFIDTSAPSNNLSEFIKNDLVVIEDDYYEVPLIGADDLIILPIEKVSEEEGKK